MATTKKSTVETEEIVENVEEVKPAPKKVNKPKHDPNELILCRSVRCHIYFDFFSFLSPKFILAQYCIIYYILI